VAATTLLHHTDHSAFLYTVKATNFGPHGNFGPLFQKGLLLLKRILQKNEENKSCRNSLDVQIRFCSFLVHDSSKEATELAREGPKLEALTVASNSCNVHDDYAASLLQQVSTRHEFHDEKRRIPLVMLGM
jgi:hypothetical protein